MFNIKYITDDVNRGVMVQYYWPGIRAAQFSNIFPSALSAYGQEYIVAVWHIKLKS